MYNAESFIKRCLLSVVNQDIPLNEFEVICVNDGSKDRTRDIVLELADQYNNIVLLDQENSGVSAARNKALDNAQGKFVMMVDADDYLIENVLASRLEFMELKGLEMGICGYAVLDEYYNEVYRFSINYESDRNYSGIEYFNRYEKENSSILDPHRSWAIFFQLAFLNRNSFRYTIGTPFLEDGEFMAKTICKASRVVHIEGPIYNRTTTPGSATQSGVFYTDKSRKGFYNAAFNLLRFREHSNCSLQQREFLNERIIHFVVLYIISVGLKNFLIKYNELYFNLKKGELRKMDTRGCLMYYRRLGTVYNLSLGVFMGYWILSQIINSIRIKLSKSIR
jgi:glycosyltransferase involved in cell wall biosynthesis